MSDDSFDPVAVLLRRAGRGPAPSPEATARLRAGVHAAWRAEVARRRRKRWFAAAASVLIAFGAAWGVLLVNGPVPAPIVARLVETAEGVVLERDGAERAAASGDDIAAGDVVGVDGTRGTALAVLRDGARIASLRLAPGSRLAWEDAHAVRLEAGQLYLDIAADRPGDQPPLTVRAGSVRIEHVGTRFMTRIDAGEVDVAVRDGSVRVSFAASALVLGGGERALVRDGKAERLRLPPSDPAWQWAETLASRVELEGRSLQAVLRDLTTEAGLELRFDSPEVEREAAATILHGPPLRQPPRTALQAVVATTLFQLDSDADAGRVTLRRR